MSTLTFNARLGNTWTYTKSNTFGDNVNTSGLNFTDNVSNGTGDGTADRIYLASPTIAASGNLQLDLSGSLLDVFGDAVVFARIKHVMITFQADNVGSEISVGGGTDGAGAAAFVGWFGAANDKEKVHKSGAFFKFRDDVTAWAVTATTADILRIDNLDGANSVKLNVCIIGCSA